MKPTIITSWVLQLIAAIILAQTLYFKFTGAAESVAIFSELGAEPFGRLFVGFAELVTVALILTPSLAGFGGLVSVGLMFGALGSHVFVLGFDGERGELALLGFVAMLASAGVVFLRRQPVIALAQTLLNKFLKKA